MLISNTSLVLCSAAALLTSKHQPLLVHLSLSLSVVFALLFLKPHNLYLQNINQARALARFIIWLFNSASSTFHTSNQRIVLHPPNPFPSHPQQTWAEMSTKLAGRLPASISTKKKRSQPPQQLYHMEPTTVQDKTITHNYTTGHQQRS